MNCAYQICNRCVMDTSDPDISFDEGGVCNHCREFATVTKQRWFPNEEGARRLSSVLERIRTIGAGQRYDCILGLSGGVDSSYLALRAHEWQLRPLVIHVDAGWNSEGAVWNIERIVKHFNYDLHTHVVNWDEMRDLQLAYLRAGVSNQDVPQDHVFFASLYQFATRHHIRHVLSGGNIATEAIFPRSWHGDAMDRTSLRAIHRRYGERPLRTYATVSFLKQYVVNPFIKGMRTVRPLNYLPYNRAAAIAELEAVVGWRPYGRKHCESLFTRFFQNYYLPQRFGYDKRRPHLSSLIVSNQMTRDEALVALEAPLYSSEALEADLGFVCKKLGIDPAEFAELMAVPKRTHADFPNQERIYRTLKMAQKAVQLATGKPQNVYS